MGPASAGSHPSWWRSAPNFVAKNVYVTQESGSGAGKLFEFTGQNRNNNAPLCMMSVPNFVNDIAADTSGNLYMPDVAKNRVEVFKPRCGALFSAINDRFGAPQGIVIQGSALYIWDGVGVSVCTMQGCSSHLTDSAITQLVSAAADLRGNVWGAGYGAHGITLVVWKGAHMPGHVVAGYIASGAPGDIMFDDANNLVTVDFPFAQAYRFKCQLVYFACTQLVKVNLQGGSNFGALNGANSDIQVTDYTNTSVDVYTYPNFTYEYSYTAGFSNRAAVKGIAQVP